VTPFVYPKSKHLRRECPGELSTYPKYKPFLQREFARKCVYCRMPDSMKGYESFGVDHYRPKSKFPELATAYANLFYACNPCNLRKGSYWPKQVQAKTHFIPNPCDHEMFRHIRFKGSKVEARTVAGRVLLETLDLNDDSAVEYRAFIVRLIESTAAKKAELERSRSQLEELRATGAVQTAEVDEAIDLIDEKLRTLSMDLARLAGE